MAGFAARKKTFGDYVEVDLIGKGTFGQVYLVKKADEKGKDESRIQKYALKKIPFPAANREREEELVKREEDILKTVKHRHLVRYVDSFRDKDTVFMVMEYCDGGTLHSYIRELNEGMPEDMFLCFVEQIAHGLKYLHKKKIMHRDIKTKNILMTRGNILKICDFGISKFAEHAGPAANSVWMGTPRYMSPEVVRKEPYEFKTDIWSLGCTAYEMAMSKYAFSAENLERIFKDISANKVPDLSGIPYCDDIKTLIRNMLEVIQRKRPSAKEVLKVIAEHECTVPITQSTKASPGRRKDDDEDSDQSTLASTTERSLPHTLAAFGTTGDSGLGYSSKLKHSSSKAKYYLEKASTEFQSMLVEIIHSRNGVDIVKEIKSASSLKEAEQALKRNRNSRVTKKFKEIMQIIESLYNTEREIHRLDDIDATFSSLESQTVSTFSSTPSRSRTRSSNT